MSLPFGNLQIVARLPRLGPVIGWRRPHPKDPAKLLTRLWIKADDCESQPAMFGLTARWKDGLVKNSVQLWRICTADMGGTAPPAQECFALADIESGLDEEGIVRFVTIHVTHGSAPSRRRLKSGEPLIISFNELEVMAEAQEVDGASPPRADELSLDEFLSDDVIPSGDAKLTREALGETLLKLAADLFDELDRATKEGRVTRPPGKGRPTPRERAQTIRWCEALLRPQRGEGERLRFAAGCCRHPGVNFDRKLADRALGALAQRATQQDGPEFVLMLGDQIYADATAGVIDAEDRLEKYTARYLEAFESTGFRRLVRSVPVYMAGDDHEIRDNWPKDTIPPGAPTQLRKLLARSEEWAKRLFLAHQRSHGPDRPRWAPAGGPPGLWYALDVGGFPFFCFDTRFERTPDGTRMMMDYQLDRFRAWLDELGKHQQLASVPKFILSGSVFAPFDREFAGRPEYARRADSWAGYPLERGRVMHEIIAREVQNAVFLSGDYHCGAVASLHCAAAPGLRCYAVVAPPFYAPFPFANMRADAVEKLEKFQVPGKDNREVEIQCQAKAFPAAGFAVLSVEPPPGGINKPDWVISVDYYGDEWDAQGRAGATPRRTARLEGGNAT